MLILQGQNLINMDKHIVTSLLSIANSGGMVPLSSKLLEICLVNIEQFSLIASLQYRTDWALQEGEVAKAANFGWYCVRSHGVCQRSTVEKKSERSYVQRSVTYTAVTGEFGLPWRLQTVQCANVEIGPQETENLKH